MDKLTNYANLIKRLLSEFADLVSRTPSGEAEIQCAFDDERGQYLLLKTGRAGGRRVRGTTLYLRIRGEKIWIEEDWTEDGIATRLVAAGVPRDDIVLAFHPADARPHTEYATA